MKKINHNMKIIFMLFIMATLSSGCEFLLGSKQNDTVDEIFEQGAIDPNLNPNNVGYVPILPIWKGFSNPIDVFVGYDEMVYVIDDNGLNIMDQTGRIFETFPIPGATDVIQDRRLHTYVAGRVEIEINGEKKDLAAVYQLINTATASPIEIVDTLIHPFADLSRNNTQFRGQDDIDVEFTGLSVLSDNTLYVTRKGPRNDLASIARPDNTILFFDEKGTNIGYANGLNPVSSSLKSVLSPVSIATFVSPPQSLNGFSNSPEFVIVQSDLKAQYKVLWIKQYVDPETGASYGENPELIDFDTSKAERFLYEPNRFQAPTDVFIATDFSGYIFVVDAGTDSLYQFTRKGFEGVNPPATSNITKQIIASFGGEGSGTFQFIDPSGVCYFRKTVYVADKGNGRIIRYKLSTDLE
jgi:hypothetical protein